MKIDLPSGGWVLFRDPLTVRRRDRRRVLEALDDVEGFWHRQYVETDTLLALAVVEWSFDLPIPSQDIDSLGDLTPADDDKLTTVVKEFEAAAFPNFTQAALEDDAPKEEPPPGTSDG